jgi:dihydroflavonol-4-reductase
MSARVVLVTGGTGFLGAEIVRRLAAQGDEVHVLARASSKRTSLEGHVSTWHTGDLTDEVSVGRAVSAVAGRARASAARALLVHAGALISYKSSDRAQSFAANVDGTRYVLTAAARERFTRAVHVSSVVTVAGSERGEPCDERAAFNLGELGVAYVDSKRAGEQLALALARELDLVVVNPGAIFGAVERKSNTARFIALVSQGKCPLLAPPGAISVLGLADAALGTLAALERGRRGERYILAESWLSSLELFRLIARLVERRGPLGRVPKYLWPALVRAARAWDALAPLELSPPEALVMLGQDLRLTADKARTELGFAPEPFERVLARTIDDLRARGLLERAPPAAARAST